MLSPAWLNPLAENLLRSACGQEALLAVFLSSTRGITGVLTSLGERDSIHMPIEKIIDHGAHTQARHIVLMHTHPSGDPRPSRQDMIATKRLHARLRARGMRLYDHVIVAHGRCYSFRSHGLI